MANFRKRHRDTFKDTANQFPLMLVEAEVVNLKTLAIDGTKLKAYAAHEKMMTARTARERAATTQRRLERLLARSVREDDADAQAEEAGKTLYGLRKCTVETTFGCINDAIGFRYPTMRSLTGIQTE